MSAPRPGSFDARALTPPCTCDPYLNLWGRGAGDGFQPRRFVVADGCPVHAGQPAPVVHAEPPRRVRAPLPELPALPTRRGRTLGIAGRTREPRRTA